MKKLYGFGKYLIAVALFLTGLLLGVQSHTNSQSISGIKYYYHHTASSEYLIPLPNYIEDKQIDEAIQKSVRGNYQWIPDTWEPVSCIPLVPFISNRFFSSSIELNFESLNRRYSSQLYTMLDLQTGEIVYLNDLLEVDERLAERILTSQYIHFEGLWADVYGPDYQQFLNQFTVEDILSVLSLCSEPFDENNCTFKPTFYLSANRLYFVNIFPLITGGNNEFYMELKDLEDLLKVKKWY